MDEDISDLNLRNMVNAVAIASENVYNANQIVQPEETQPSTSEMKWSQDEDNFDSEMQQLIPTQSQIDNSFEEASLESEPNEQLVETTESNVSQFVSTEPLTIQVETDKKELEAVIENAVQNDETIGKGENDADDSTINNDSSKNDDSTKNNDVIENDTENTKGEEEQNIDLKKNILKEDVIDDVVIVEDSENLEENHLPKRKTKATVAKKEVDHSKKCRICMDNNPTISLFKSRDVVPGSEKMLACSAIQITEDDGLPQYICRKCDTNLDIAYQLKILCEKSDLFFREVLGVKNKTIVKRELILLDCNEISDSSDDMSIAKYKSRKGKSAIDSDGDYSPTKSKRGRKKNSEKLMTAPGNNTIKLNHVAQAAIVTPKYVCKHCSKVFVRVETYNNHLETHKKNKYPCPTCTESFKTEKAQYIHTKMAHAVMPKIKYKCSKCDKEYDLMRHLKIHEAAHNREKKHKCDVCMQEFSNLVVLTQHKKDRHPVEGKSFKCQICSLRFRSEDAVKRHTQMAHTAKSIEEKKPLSTRDLFKSIAPLTSTYWSDSYSD